MYTIYLITNKVNNKKYVGVTKRNYIERYKEHLVCAQSSSYTNLLYCAMRKYGVENFDVTVVAENIPDEIASQQEQYYITKFNTYYIDGQGYNMTIGGNGTVGYIFTDEVKQKISKGLTGHVFPKSRNQKIKEAMTGREYKQEWREALSKVRMGRFTKEENGFYGKHHSEATKDVIGSKNTKHHVCQLDPKTLEVLHVFKNSRAAGKWVVAQGLTSAKPDTCAGRIDEVCKFDSLNHTAYTYRWRYKEKSID